MSGGHGQSALQQRPEQLQGQAGQRGQAKPIHSLQLDGQAWGLPRGLLRASLALILGLVLLLPAPGQQGSALAWTLPARKQATSAEGARPTPAPAAAIQEVAPPAAVQQISEALAQRRPRLSILEPSDGAVLPDGPWTLRLQLEDWPLVDGGPLGLGPHLLVQLDDDPPMRLLETSLSLPALSPGSHRLTVMAARPWGEVVKRPGAFQQIRLHRVSPNPLSQPAPGTPQLLAVAPLEASPSEPLLLDWLLLDAPLQHLRGDDARWRLRVSVNGDSFLVEQETPLWLKGWKRGSNALLLELVDGRGEPLNPPFNSMVREVRLAADAARPAWLGGRLADADLQRLLGQAQPPKAGPAAANQADPGERPAQKTTTPTETAQSQAASAEAPSGSGEAQAAGPAPSAPTSPPLPTIEAPPAPPQAKAPDPSPQSPSQPAGGGSSGAVDAAAAASDPKAPPPAVALSAASQQPPATPPTPQSRDSTEDPQVGASDVAASEAGSRRPPPSPGASATAPSAGAAATRRPEVGDGGPPPGDPQPSSARSDPAATASDSASATVVDASPPQPVAAPPTPPRPAARDEVNADGTLIRPQRSGPLQALRERLQR